MVFYLVAIAFGILRWRWWTLLPVLAGHLAWLWYVDLAQIRQITGASNDIRTALESEATMIAMAGAGFALVVCYIIDRAVRALTYGSGKSQTAKSLDPED